MGMISNGHSRVWEFPQRASFGTDLDQFLRVLGKPTWILIPGKDSSRTRAMTTLIHGNEPSGVRALFRFLKSEAQPAVNLMCFVGVTPAALAPPGFAHRFLPEGRDLNRCFREPFEGYEGQLAKEILDTLSRYSPESLIDLHNTSGKSPSYGVTTQYGIPQITLTSLFSDHLILTDLRLGTLMEATEYDFPTITVECGGAQEPQADEVAFLGLCRYAMSEDVFKETPHSSKVHVSRHPIRVELDHDATVAYASQPLAQADLTLRADVDQFNFGVVKPGEELGWVGSRGLKILKANDAQGKDLTQILFKVQQGKLLVAKPTRVLMMTTDPTIAKSDCLFYFLPMGSFE